MAVKADILYDSTESMPVQERHRLLEEKLSRAIGRAYRHSAFTRQLMDQAGVKPAQIKTYSDLQKIPITRKNDVIEAQKKSPPYGGLLTVDPSLVERVFIAPGPIYEPLHTSRIKWFARAFWAAGFRKGDVVINTFTYHLSPAGMLFYEALRQCGATVVNTGVGNTDIQIQALRDLPVDGFVGTPSFLFAMIKKVEENGDDFRRLFNLKKAWFTGEMLATSTRNVLEKDYGIRTSQAYAVTEPGGCLAYECSRQNGLHMMDDYVFEIVDPATGQQLPPGETGEIVVTPIHNRTWGLIRFGTGDLSRYITGKCSCGRTAHRLTGILGRAGDAIKVRGMFVVTRQADEVIKDGGKILRYQLVVTRENQRDILTLKAECLPDKNLENNLNDRFQNTCRVKIDKFEFLAAGSLPENAPVVNDLRKWD